MDFRLVRGDKSDRAQFCRKISWDFDTERGRLAFVARLIGLANETECRIIGAVDDKSRRSLFCVSRSDLRNLSSQTLPHYQKYAGSMQDFPKPWTDAELYKKYKLTKDEIVFIESMIKPME